MSLYELFTSKGPSGFGYGSTAEQVTEGLSLEGKTFLVTGCNSGLGLRLDALLCNAGIMATQTEQAFGYEKQFFTNHIGQFILATALVGLLVSMFTTQRFVAFVMTPNREDLRSLKALVEAGRAKLVLERSFPLSQAGAALRHVAEGHARGQTVIRV